MRKKIGAGVLELVVGDITMQEVDAIVNAANARLAGGGGVDGAIHRRGGPEIMAECRRIGGCVTGSVAVTGAGKLKAKAVFHAVGPVWHGGDGDEAEQLASCYRIALELARDHGFVSIAFPSISTGVYGYPVDEAAEIAIDAIIAFMTENALPSLVRMVLFDETTYAAYDAALNRSSKQ